GFSRELIVGIGRSSLLAGHFMKESRFEHPRHQLFAADAERMIDALVWPCGKAVERYRKGASSHFSHCVPPSIVRRQPATFWGRTAEPVADIFLQEIWRA